MPGLMMKYCLVLGRILPIDVDVTLQCARLHVPDPLPERDALIAAAALVHKLTVVTRNVNDFLPTGVQLLNPRVKSEVSSGQLKSKNKPCHNVA